MSRGELHGKVAVITGGASGIGRATAKLFVHEGARVVIADIDDVLGEEAAEELGSAARYIHADVTISADVENLVSAATKTFGKLDVMFNNAGAAGDPARLAELSESSFAKITNLITNSVLFGHQHAVRQFRKQGTGGAIVSTSSAAGIQSGWGPAGYTIAKHAVTGIVKVAAAELGRFGIRSNAVAPGTILTPIMLKAFDMPPEKAEDFLHLLDAEAGRQQPAGRAGRPEDVAEAVLWLASDRSSYISGVTLPVDGGATGVYAADFGEAAGAIAARLLAN
jgi:NAD(P)-dependent dehydrogenase (short-subunit alcohol dehydrogenase family)